ncbi:MAG: leucine-rich repeat protein [Ruminococcus sp.]|nr:leucine-rich repeat protein [Ruminococcus sp.]
MLRKRLLSLAAAALLALSPAAGAAQYYSSAITAYAQEEILNADAADHSELLDKCRGYYAYNDLGKQENGANLQKFYNKLYEVYSDVWTSDTDYTLYPGQTDLYVVDQVRFTSYGLTKSEAILCYYALRDDNPVMYYLINQYSTGSYTFYAPINRQYTKASVRKALQEEISEYIEKMTAPLSGYTRRFEKALILHDKLLPLMTYNYDAVTIGSKISNKETVTAAEQDMHVYSHNIIGAVKYQTGVCESYAKTYQMLLNYAGVDNVYVVGTDVKNSAGHAWNAVKMDNGTYYFVDATFDDHPETHKYFAKGYTVFNENHIVREANMSSYNYFYELPTIPTGDYSCQANSPSLKTVMDQFAFYINEDNTVTVTRYLGSAEKVNIPEKILDMKVTGIGSDCFFNKPKVSEVNIPEGVTSIGDGAFLIALTSSKTITIPKSVTSIGDYAVGYRNSLGGSYNFDGNYSALAPTKISGFTIKCYKNSAAYNYAVKNGISYELLANTVTAGDADSNGKVNIADVIRIQQYLAGWKVKVDLTASDVDANGKVNIADVIRIQQHLAGWKVTLKTA